MTLTIDNLPDELEQALRDRAAAENKTIGATVIDVIARGLGVDQQTGIKKRDLSFMSEGPPLEPEVLAALEEQRQIDPDLWR